MSAKRKVYVHEGPIKHLTEEDCERLAEEAERYRLTAQERLDRLDLITGEDWHLRVK